VISPVSEGYFTGSSRLFFRWDPPRSPRRLDLVALASGTSYGSQANGNDSDLRLTARYREGLGSRIILNTSVAGWRFRREEAAIFDLDLLRGEARLGWAPRRNWLVSLGARYTRSSYPNRLLPPDSTKAELQQPFDVVFGMLRSLGRTGYLGSELSYRVVASNTPRSRYRGPVVVLRAGTEVIHRTFLSGYAVYGRRDYRESRILVRPGATAADSVEARRDDAWQIGMNLERRLGNRLRLFLEGDYLIQNSNASFADFDQAQVSIGVSVDVVALGGRREPSAVVSRPSPLAPLISGNEVRFRILAPRADSVSVVGGFNGWDPARNPLRGPGPDGRWEATVRLAPGIWRYAFVVDGVWTVPPDAPRYEPDGFGGRNGMLEVVAGSGGEAVTDDDSIRPRR